MNMKKTILALAVVLSASATANAQDAIPVVPASVMKNAAQEASRVKTGMALIVPMQGQACLRILFSL